MTGKKDTKRQRTIVIIDDHPIVRQGLAELIANQDDLVVCGEADDVATGLEVIKEMRPDLAIIDISLKDSNGIELIKDLKLQMPDLPVLVLSMHDESFYAERVLRAGAKGYVTKAEAAETVIVAVRKILDGQIYLSEKMSSKILARLVAGPGGAGVRPIERLTDRELQIFELIGGGISTRRIAQKLHLSVKTIESHRENIKRKLRIGNSVELLQHAIRWVQVEHGG